MKNINFHIIFGFVLLLFLVGCAPQELPPSPSPTPTALVQTVSTPTSAAEETALVDENEQEKGEAELETESTPEETAVEEPTQKADYCLECHSDQATLIDTAAPFEELESENEGEG